MPIKYEQVIEATEKVRILQNMPNYYGDSVVVSDILDAIMPEIQQLLEMLFIVEENAEFPDDDMRTEIDAILANEIGQAPERTVYQFYPNSSNNDIQEHRILYGVEDEFTDIVALRSRLLFMGKQNRTISPSDVTREIEHDNIGTYIGMVQNYSLYTASISMVSNLPNGIAMLTERLNNILPAHINFALTFSAVRLTDIPTVVLTDGAKLSD